MEDPVALASVLSSALVALGGLFVTYRSGREQRQHEARLSYEERAWQEKSSALFRVIAETRALLDLMQSKDAARGELLGVRVGPTLEALDDLVPMVESYASAGCRAAFEDFRRVLRDAGPDSLAHWQLETIREKKTAAIDAQDFPGTAALRAQERKFLQETTAALDLDVQDAIRRADTLLDAARSSVRGDQSA